MMMNTVCTSVPGDFLVVLSVVALTVKQTVIDNDKRRHEVNQFARWQHAEISSGVPASVPVTARQTDAGQGNYYLYSTLAVDSTHMAVGLFRLLVRRSGTHCQTKSEIRRVMSTASNSSLKQSCSAFTSATSALEVNFNVMRSINSRFTYLLTY